MSIADALAAIEKEPTAAQLVNIFKENGMPLKSKGGSLIIPKGITPDMAEMLVKHEDSIVSALHPTSKKEKDKEPDAHRA